MNTVLSNTGQSVLSIPELAPSSLVTSHMLLVAGGQLGSL